MTSPQYSHDPTAVVGRRFGAYVIDMLLIPLILAIVPLVMFFATADLTEYTGGPPCAVLESSGLSDSGKFCITEVNTSNTQAVAEHSTITFSKSALWTALGLFGALHLIYLVVVLWIVQANTGATAGKALFGIRTVDEAGAPPGMGKQFVRGILWIVDSISICGLPLIAILTILMSKGHRRLGDMAAKTYVVGLADAGSPIVVPQAGGAVPGSPPPGGPPSYGAAPPVAGGGEELSFAPPPAGSTAPAAAPEPSGSPPPPSATQAEGPQWDAARNAYIYWDASRSAWLIHDAASGEWKPLT